MKTVLFPFVTQQSIDITDAEYAVVYDLYQRDMKVTAIKFIRNQYGLELKAAKDICDSVGMKSPYANGY